MVYQELNLAPNLSVAENVFVGRYPLRSAALGVVDRRRMVNETRALLTEYGVDLDPARQVSSLGTGQRQLLEILRAVHRRARLLLLDEPTSALSQAEVELLFERILRRMKAQGVSVIYVSHRLEEVFAIADRITVLRDGERVATGLRGDLGQDDVIRAMVGRDLGERYLKERVPVGEVCLTVKDLRAGPAVRGCSLQLRQGEIVGLAGLMGFGPDGAGQGAGGAHPAGGRGDPAGWPAGGGAHPA